jgi:hypothetical protein
MTSDLQRLGSIGGEALQPKCERTDLEQLTSQWGTLGNELAALLSSKNGFYAFEKALLVRPLKHDGLPKGIWEWNAPTLWKNDYEGMLDAMLCFAEDVFGNQFALQQEEVLAVDAETGEAEHIASTLEEWASVVLEDYNYRTGYPLAHDWQVQHGPLSVGLRLLPKAPFVTGGKFELNNLYALGDAEGMRFRGSIARQIRDLPDGAHVVFDTKGTRKS